MPGLQHHRSTARGLRLGVVASLALAGVALVAVPSRARAAGSSCQPLPLVPCPAPAPPPPPPPPAPTVSPPTTAPNNPPSPPPGGSPSSGSPSNTGSSASQQPAGEVPGGAQQLLALVNQARAAAGVGALRARMDVTQIAAGHSQAMAAAGSIWHNDDYFTPATKARLGAVFVGENVAMNPTLDGAHQRLMASPGHRANILDGRFSVVGISVVSDGKGELFVTQDFAELAPAAAPAGHAVLLAERPRSDAGDPPAAANHGVPADVTATTDPVLPPLDAPRLAGAAFGAHHTGGRDHAGWSTLMAVALLSLLTGGGTWWWLRREEAALAV